MPESNFEEVRETPAQIVEVSGEFEDLSIPCIDCAHEFVWTAGEQAFFRDKQLQNPPKRCKDCKKAKNLRLEAIELSRITGKRHRIEVRAECARCSEATTVPFYPCQGRPVYCRSCFQSMNVDKASGANGSA
ncbi:MAG: zinc-ribbon domain containing protein [Pyrinomonadaceae bacterium]